jgi:hypothetical protein
MDIDDGDLAFLPLGGTGEIGMNLNLYRCDGKWLAVDCGIGFGGAAHPEVDVMMADPGYIAGYVPVFGAQTRNVLLGAPEVGGDTLLRFYVLHIYFIPTLIFVGLGIHIWRVRKDGFAVSDRKRMDSDAATPAPAMEKETVDAGS